MVKCLMDCFSIVEYLDMDKPLWGQKVQHTIQTQKSLMYTITKTLTYPAQR